MTPAEITAYVMALPPAEVPPAPSAPIAPRLQIGPRVLLAPRVGRVGMSWAGRWTQVPNEKFITLRRLEPGETMRDGDFYMSTDGPDAGEAYREVNPIPEGYEVCDLADATKVLIGDTWCEVEDESLFIDGILIHKEVFSTVGVLAIRPIPEPEPMMGTARCYPFSESETSGYGWVPVPHHLIGKTIWWEVVKDENAL